MLGDKPKIYFAPLSLSGVAYYQRLIPYLQNRYSIGFLLVGYDNHSLQLMIEYCRKMSHVFSVINLGQKRDSGFRIPFISPVKKILAHKKECQEFIEKSQPAKIIFDKTAKQHSTMAHEANRYGVETIILQPAMVFASNNTPSVYSNWLSPLRGLYFLINHFLYNGIRFLQGDGFYVEKGQEVTPRKLGVIDEIFAKIRVAAFNPEPAIVRVVGTLEIQHTHELKERLSSDVSFKRMLLKKYNINPKNINILVPGYRFTQLSGDGKRSLSKEEHVKCFKNIFSDIQNVLAEKEINILFKTHMGDKDPDIYESYKRLGVSIYGDDARLDELLCLSQLCIIDPWTAANYMVLASDVPAIFIDFDPVKGRVVPKEHFRIKEIIDTRDRFVEMLKNFRDGKLEKQYNNNGLNVKVAEQIVDLINI